MLSTIIEGVPKYMYMNYWVILNNTLAMYQYLAKTYLILVCCRQVDGISITRIKLLEMKDESIYTLLITCYISLYI